MRYEMISADCHLDLCWLPQDLFTANAAPALRDRMPHVVDSPKGPTWITKKGASLGFFCGMGSAGREYVPGRIHRADRMAETGLYADGKKGIRRLTDPELRLKDQDRDGVQAEVLYGILGATGRMNDPEAVVEVIRVYNEWLADFCSTHPERFAGLASIPNAPIDAAIAEVERVAKRGAVRGLDIANSPDLTPLWDPYWNPLWEVIQTSGLPLHFHTIGSRLPENLQKLVFVGSDPSRATADMTAEDRRASRIAFATHITGFQINMANILMAMIYGGVLERFPRLRAATIEAGIGWVPWFLGAMDEAYRKHHFWVRPKLARLPSEYYREHCWASFQEDPAGLALAEPMGLADRFMWGNDYPHHEGTWPHSAEAIERTMGQLSDGARAKVLGLNCARFLGIEVPQRYRP